MSMVVHRVTIFDPQRNIADVLFVDREEHTVWKGLETVRTLRRTPTCAEEIGTSPG
jgi:hypothetical protein